MRYIVFISHRLHRRYIKIALRKYVIIVFTTAESMSCIHIKQQILGVNENSACTFHIRWNELVKFQGQLK